MREKLADSPEVFGASESERDQIQPGRPTANPYISVLDTASDHEEGQEPDGTAQTHQLHEDILDRNEEQNYRPCE